MNDKTGTGGFDFSNWRPFVDFYQTNNISPVHQDISSLQRHFDRRAALYRHLGLPPGLVRGLSVIEFGPGSGHNALFTTALGPGRYVLVDGNPTGLKETRDLLAQHFPDATCHQHVEALIEDFDTDERFDVVFCEGVIPAQLDPAGFTRTVARFVRPGGLVVITCVDSASMLSETIRRLMRGALVPRGTPVAEQIEMLKPYFASHFASLAGASRPLEHWLVDAIIHPIWGSIFSMPEAIDALAPEFDFYGSSPHFVTDWRWYKNIHGDAQNYNSVAADAYRVNIANFIDCRVTLPPVDPATAGQIIALCDATFADMQRIENKGDDSRLPETAGTVGRIADLLAPISGLTARSLREAAAVLDRPSAAAMRNLQNFHSMFGRGQMYLSFIRR